jgi:hypothetical protein
VIMRSQLNNPSGNELPKGVNESVLIQAIEPSGYPLRGTVANQLVSSLPVTEEWGYVDPDKKLTGGQTFTR